VAAAELSAVEEVAGEGLRGVWLGRAVALRRPREGDGKGGASGAMASVLDIAGEPARLIAFADRLRPDWRAALAWMGQLGITPAILSGDHEAAVALVARQTGLAARGAASPADKQAVIADLQAQGYRVLMAGDGLNDGPALAAADASMAPGSASDVGRQAADFVFLADSLLAIPRTVAGARATMRVVKQNFVLAIGYNVLAVPLAIMGVVTPLLAAVAMSTSSLIVIANSLRLILLVRDPAAVKLEAEQ
jgi:Cu2+-exporting ATPase